MPPPPPLTEAQYTTFGIIQSRGYLSTAVKAANPGDCIYLAKGRHNADNLQIEKSLDLTWLGMDANVIIEIQDEDRFWKSILINERSVEMYNISFMENRLKTQKPPCLEPEQAQGSGNEPLILCCHQNFQN